MLITGWNMRMIRYEDDVTKALAHFLSPSHTHTHTRTHARQLALSAKVLQGF